jgi:transposase
MSTTELRRAGVLARVAAGTLKLGSAAALMEVSYRQAKRLYRRYRSDGAKGLKHAGAGRPSNRAIDTTRRERVLALIREKYSGGVEERFGPTLAAEHLASEDEVTVDHETLRRWMLAAGLWSRARKRSPHRRRRERKAHFGELVQLDGSFHPWFEDRGPHSCLLTLVDDATGRSLGRFGAQETIWAAVAILRAWIERYGIGDVASANAFLDTDYWGDHNRRFAQAPASADDFHVTVPRGVRLDQVFRLEEKRTVSNDWVVRYDNRLFQLERQSGRPPARSSVLVSEAADGHLEIRYRGRMMRYTEIPPAAAVRMPVAPRRPSRAARQPPAMRIRPRPSADHPWSRGFDERAQRRAEQVATT